MHDDADLHKQTIDPWLGRILAQRYRVVARIGAGGMGVVYRAWNEATQAYVVVKMPKRELIGDPTFLQRFAQELSALRALSHPSVVPISDIGNEQGAPFAVMPYLAGGSLKHRRPMFQDGRIAPEEPAGLWRWLPAIAQALDFVHACNYVHRDVKPDNILFDGLGAPYLGDFGVAKLVFQEEDAAATRGLTGTGFALGTPDYMAPELIGGTKANPLVDQYSLAVMTYELLAARKPFDGPTPAAVMVAHVTGTAPPLHTLRPGMPATVSEAVARGMSKKPEDRFDTCTAFAEAVLAHAPRPAIAEKLQLMCPQCSRLLNVKPDWAGKQGNCPRCKTALTIGRDLRSLWIPSDQAGAPTRTPRVPVGPLMGTPSRPMPVTRSIPSPTPATFPQRVSGTVSAEPESVLQALKEQLGKSVLLQGLAAVTLAVFLVAVLVLLSGNNRERPPAEPTTVAQTTAKPSAPAPPRPASQPSTAEPTQSQEIVTDRPDASVEQASPPADERIAQPPAPESTASTPIEEPPPQEAERTVSRASDDRLDPPGQADLSEALALIHQAYDDDYTQALNRNDRPPLIDKLTTTSRSIEDAVRRYALLAEAERLALEDLDLRRVVALIRERATAFRIDAEAEQKAAIDQFIASKERADPKLFDEAISLAEDCLAEDCLSVADAAAALATSVAKAVAKERKAAAAKAARDGKKAGGQGATPPSAIDDADDMLDAAATLAKTVRVRQDRFDAYRLALEKLDSEPDDETARATVARYLCFTKLDWPTGLPHLAKSNVVPLSDIAARQVSLKRSTPSTKDRFSIAGEWWDAAEDPASPLSSDEREAVRDLAASLYERVRDALTDPIDQALAQKRARRNPAKNAAPPARTSLADLIEPEAAPEKATPTPSRRRPQKLTELSARTDPTLRKQLLEMHGGTAESEAAVEAGLKWLIAHQMPDGGWNFDLPACPDCKGQCSSLAGGSAEKYRCGATCLALLAFYGHGYTHKDGPYKRELLKGMSYLVDLAQAGNGKCYTAGESMYSQGLAGITLSEAYSMTKDLRLKAPAQSAINYITESQDPQGGGWRYTPRQPGDTSATGWQVMALKAGNEAGLMLVPASLKRVDNFLASVQSDDGASYGYTSPGSGTGTSAVGLLCRSHLGWANDHPAMVRGADRLADRQSTRDLYFLYYATQVLRRMGGARWTSWNGAMRDALVSNQNRDGHAAGSWGEPFTSGHGTTVGGRLYCTAMAIMILESYYRYLSPADITALR